MSSNATSTYLICVDDMSRKPVGRHAFLHLNFQRARNWALGVLPSNVDYAFAGICKLDEGVFEKIEVVLATSRALVNDLCPVSERLRRDMRQFTNHRCDASAIGAGDFDAASAGLAIIPVRVAECSAIDAVWDSVG